MVTELGINVFAVRDPDFSEIHHLIGRDEARAALHLPQPTPHSISAKLISKRSPARVSGMYLSGTT